MCLIVFAWRPGQPQPLVLAGNRDEFHARPAQPLHAWEDHPGLYAGRDLEAGGSWMGVGPHGRFAAVTNIRRPGQAAGKRSRGALVAGFLSGADTPSTYLANLASHCSDYAGFNLLVGDRETLWYLNAFQPVPQALTPGTYGLSNAQLDTPWPKLLKARDGLTKHLDDNEALLQLLGDPATAPDEQLPETGVGIATERLLSSIFITGANYGTRASSVLRVYADGRRDFIERSFGPGGARLGEVKLNLPA